MSRISVCLIAIGVLAPLPLAAQGFGGDSFATPTQRGSKFNEPDRERARGDCGNSCAKTASPDVSFGQNRNGRNDTIGPALGGSIGAPVGSALGGSIRAPVGSTPLGTDLGDQRPDQVVR